MATHALSQVLQRSKLELLDGAFGSSKRGRHVANTLLLDEAQLDHPTLHIGQPLDLLVQRDPTIDVLELSCIGQLRRRVVRVPVALAPVIRQRVRGDPEQPDRQRHSTPLETRDRSQCLLEHLRRDVLSRGPVPGSATDEGIDSVDVPLVDLNKSSRIGLRRLCLSRPLLVSRRAVRIDPSHRGRAVSTSSYVAN